MTGDASELPGEPELPDIDFTTFVLSMNGSALIHLGRTDNPATGSSEVNLPLARQTIDLLAMLQDKTRGNLTGEEERVLEDVLYDLKLQFVEATKAAKG